ncbi:MAG: metallophosphoesterase [Undibacterium sp.]|nr:metallophosphoesterase [Undibacterium sp.]
MSVSFRSLLSLLVLGISLFVHAQDKNDDGPFVRYVEQGVQAQWYCQGQVIRKDFAQVAHFTLPAVCGFSKAIQVQSENFNFPSIGKYTTNKLAAISDIHGQYGSMKQLLQAHGIIDGQLNWSYGDGHLVITGDVLDRGDQVTEAMWLLYLLDAQAKQVGGAVHLLLGNHETMVMANDLRYVHPKYLKIAQEYGQTYPELFNQDTVLGRWLRSKPVLVQVNDSMFMHAGLHPDYLNLNRSVADVNEQFRLSLGLPKAEVKKNDTLAFLYGSLGPIWYRGYFNEPQLQEAQLDKVLQYMQVKRIVVGHTTMSGVYSHYQGKVLAIDGDIKSGKQGEILLYQNGQWQRGTLQGERLSIPELNSAKTKDMNEIKLNEGK